MRKVLASFTLATAICGSSAFAAGYTVSIDDYPGDASPGTFVSGINAQGRIVGSHSVPPASAAAFTERFGNFTPIGGDGLPCAPTRCRIGGRAINAFGKIVGTDFVSLEEFYLWTQVDNQVHLIHPPGYPDVVTSFGGLNDLGLMVGCYTTETGRKLFSELNGLFLTLPDPAAGVIDACATGLNNRGQMIGAYFTDTGENHAFIATAGHYKLIDVPADWNSNITDPRAINDSGTVVGNFETLPENFVQQSGFRYRNGTFTHIDFPGAVLTTPTAINARGDIAGIYQFTFDNTSPRVFVLRNGEYIDIPLPGIADNVAGITPRGEIVGSYHDCQQIGCGSHGFRAVPDDQ